MSKDPCIRCEGDRKKRIRVYRILDPKDQRLEVFQHWLTLARQPFALYEMQGDVKDNVESVVKDENYIQLSLDF